MNLTKHQILELLDRAYQAGCFQEVHKMILADTDLVVIEKVIEKSQAKTNNFPFNFDDLFGAD